MKIIRIVCPQSPNQVEDIFGMMSAVVLIDHSLNAGIHMDTVPLNNVFDRLKKSL
jgi:hypothetical protein